MLAAPAARADDGSSRRTGDVLSYALPAATLGVELARGDRPGALQFARSFGATLAVSELLKRTVHAERPDHSNDQSFPSGHAARAFATASYVNRRHGWRHAWPLVAASIYVGETRVAAQRHRWIDVAGAAAIAAASSRWLVKPKRATPVGAASGPPALALTVVFALP